jgi:hypothetical protein
MRLHKGYLHSLQSWKFLQSLQDEERWTSFVEWRFYTSRIKVRLSQKFLEPKIP